MSGDTSQSPVSLQGLLQSLGPWMTGGSPSALDGSFSQYGGTQGLLDAMLQAGNPNSSAAQFGKALEGSQTQALQRAAARQQLAQQGLGLQFTAMRMPLMLAAMRQRLGQIGGNASPASLNASPAAGVSAPPSGAPATGAAPAASGASPGGPMGLLNNGVTDSILGLPWANAELSAAKTGLQYDPGTAARMAAAKNQISQDIQQLYQAYASGNPQLIQGMQTKLKTDMGQLHVGSMSGIMTAQQPNGSWTTIDPRTGLRTNTATGSTLLPGAAGAQGAMAAAHALGEAQGETVDVGGVPVPKMSVLGPFSRTPAAGAPAAGVNAPGGNPFLKLLGQAKYTAETADEGSKLGNQYQEAADAARQTNYNLDQMIADAKTASLGPAAGAKEWMAKQAAGLAQMFGVKTATPQLNSYQELDKYANQVAFTATRAMGSREAAQIVHMQMESNPNKSLTPEAFADLAGSMKAMNNYVIAKNLFVQQQAKANGGDLRLASAQWTRTVDPRVWDLALSPAMGEKWAATIGKNNIEAAWPYLTADEQQALVANIPMSVRAQWLK